MTNAGKHIINKVYVEVNTASKEQAYHIKDNLDVFLKEHVFQQIENHFDTIEKDIKNNIVRIEKLDLDLTVNSDFKYDDLKQKITVGLEKVIREKIEDSIVSKDHEDIFLTSDDNILTSFFYFLERGTMPWWKGIETSSFLLDDEVLYGVLEKNEFERLFQEKIKQSYVRKRFIKQFSDQAIITILIHSYKNSSANNHIDITRLLNDELILLLEAVQPEFRTEIWNQIIIFYTTVNPASLYQTIYKLKDTLYIENEKSIKSIQINSSEIFKNFQKKIVWFDMLIETRQSNNDTIKSDDPKPIHLAKKDTDKNIEDQIKTDDKNRQGIKDDIGEPKVEPIDENTDQIDQDNVLEQEGYYLENAGLILIHPFLKHFFEHCELLNEDGTINDPELAVHVLHYLTTKNENQPEYLMILEKFLCNVPIHKSIHRNITIPQKIKEQSEELLQAVIQNWGALKNASSDLLRNEFLQRSGKLVLTDKSPKIIVERKTQDILLDRLPWNISIVKLPWKDKLIFVDW